MILGVSGLAAEAPSALFTDYVCRDYRRAILEKGTNAFDLIMGRGVITQWKLALWSGPRIWSGQMTDRKGTYVLSGEMRSSNTGTPAQGIPIYIGNLSQTNLFKLKAISDGDGAFTFTFDAKREVKTEEVYKHLFLGDGQGEARHLLQ